MFYYVSGTVAHVESYLAVIDCGGVGYACKTTSTTISQLQVGKASKLYTYLHVGEGIFDLYGFATQGELGSFKQLIGISGGVSYGALGMSHHSAQDIAAMSAIPNMRVYLPSDRFQTAELVRALVADNKPAYIRVGRNPVEDVYTEDECPFQMDRATWVRRGADVTIVATGEMVRHAVDAADLLAEQGISATVLDMYCVKPLDAEAVIEAAGATRAVVTVEEHSPFGGLGSMVAQGEHCPRPVKCLSLPDAPVITGTSPEVFAHYGLTGAGIAKTVAEFLPAE